MKPREDENRLRHMLDHAVEAMELAKNHSRADLDADRMLNLALVRLLEVIGEAAARVTADTRTQLDEIPWPPIIGLRNRLIHGYDDVDFDILWSIIVNDLPPLVTSLRAALDGQG